MVTIFVKFIMSNSLVLFKNIISLYGFTIAKLVFPMLVLPYLTRVLSLEAYGLVAYVKTIMSYMQQLVDFGFMLSGTREVVEIVQGSAISLRVEGGSQQCSDSSNPSVSFADSPPDATPFATSWPSSPYGGRKGDQGMMKTNIALNQAVGDIMVARLLNAGIALLILAILIFAIPILSANKIFVFFSFATIFASIFLFDYVFRGLEQMQVITYRFMVMKSISTVLTFFVVKSDADIMWIPALDLAGSLVAVGLVLFELRKFGITPQFTTLANAVKKLKESAIYFASEASTSVFGALNTVLVGIFLPLAQVAFWSLVMQILGAVQSLYSPITSGLFPRMVATKSKGLLLKMFAIFVPVVFAGCVFTYFISDYAVVLIAGEKYLPSAEVLRWVTPWLFLGFPAMLFGWPALGAIGKVRQVTSTTVGAAIFQVIGLAVLGFTGNFTLLTIAVLRNVTEFLFTCARMSYCWYFSFCSFCAYRCNRRSYCCCYRFRCRDPRW